METHSFTYSDLKGKDRQHGFTIWRLMVGNGVKVKERLTL